MEEPRLTLPPPTNDDEQQRMQEIDRLKTFLADAPCHWTRSTRRGADDDDDEHDDDDDDEENDQEDPIQRYALATGESISCVRWQGDYYITGTDIVRCLVFRFHAFGRPVDNMKKFEEGIFSDLRNLKPGTDARLEEPKSKFLDLLYKNNCIRTQKKQKVFHWYAVPHDRLFLDALERDLKRERLGIETTSTAVAQPATNINLDSTQAIVDEFRKHLLHELGWHASSSSVNSSTHGHDSSNSPFSMLTRQASSTGRRASVPSSSSNVSNSSASTMPLRASTLFGHLSLFEGSPTYKQRRRRSHATMTVEKKHGNSSCHHHHHQTHALSASKTTTSPQMHLADHEKCDPSMARFFTCPIYSCRKIFKRLEHMKRHLRTHTMERPYLCSMCGKRFSRSDNLAQHKKTHKRHVPLSPLADRNKRQCTKDTRVAVSSPLLSSPLLAEDFQVGSALSSPVYSLHASPTLGDAPSSCFASPLLDYKHEDAFFLTSPGFASAVPPPPISVTSFGLDDHHATDHHQQQQQQPSLPRHPLTISTAFHPVHVSSASLSSLSSPSTSGSSPLIIKAETMAPYLGSGATYATPPSPSTVDGFLSANASPHIPYWDISAAQSTLASPQLHNVDLSAPLSAFSTASFMDTLDYATLQYQPIMSLHAPMHF
ncbi:STE like transcription factor-domain-containing protein [Gongronella butleri]|nr:STE like transcription factor-domain-containing protein [Gongronella butleri]